MQLSSLLWSVSKNPHNLNLMGYLDQILHLFILILYSHSVLQNGGEGLPSIIFASQGLLVKMLITLEPHSIF